MPEKIRVSPAPASQLSTGRGQAALVPEADELLEDPDAGDELLVEELEELEESDDELEAAGVDDDSDFAGIEPLPDERLSVR
jgi:hypothetical protein